MRARALNACARVGGLPTAGHPILRSLSLSLGPQWGTHACASAVAALTGQPQREMWEMVGLCLANGKGMLVIFHFLMKNIFFSYFMSYLVILAHFFHQNIPSNRFWKIFYLFFWYSYFCVFQYFSRPVSKIGLNWGFNRGKNCVKIGVLKIFQLLFLLKIRIENLPNSIYLRMTIYIYISIYIYINIYLFHIYLVAMKKL